METKETVKHDSACSHPQHEMSDVSVLSQARDSHPDA